MAFLRFIKNWILPVLLGLAVAFSVQHYYGVANVSGESMDPTLYDTERLLINRQAKINRFDIIIFNASGIDPENTAGDDYVKRVIGLPGDTLTYNADGTLTINGHNYTQPFIQDSQSVKGTLNMNNGKNYPNGFDLKTLSNAQNWPRKMTSNVIPPNEYFVLGDNRSVSNDSRYWGLVPKDKIIGVTKYTMSFKKLN